MIDPRLIRKADARQLKLTANELQRLAVRVQEDFQAGISDHDARMRRFTRYYRRWRGLTEVPALGEEDKPNFSVPLTQWQVFSKWAKEHGALFGEDADIEAKPIGPNDQRLVKKVSRFSTWLAFDLVKIQNPASIFDFRKILFGRSHAYAPWVREMYDVPMADGTTGQDLAYEGPLFDPMWPDDLIVPAEDAKTIHDFSWVIRKYRATPDELLRGEEQERYQGISDNWELLVSLASHRRQREFETERVKQQKDLAEGVVYDGNLSAGSTLIVHEWYGKWRRLKGKRDARTDNLDGRSKYESELVVRYLPDLHLVIGVQDLADMYPRKVHRRPFVEASLVKDGSYWCQGFGELLESMELELSGNHQLATQAGQFSVGPIIFYKPGSGFDPDTFEYEPFKAVASDDPAGIRVVDMRANLEYPIHKEQAVIGYAERVTGQTDMNMGRAIDRPNAPRTAHQTMALLSEGDVRASLEMNALREDWGAILTHFWELCQDYAPEKMFFRVTEEDASGLFDVKRGGSYMTSDERNGRYDFDLKFATNAWSKEQRKQDDLALYQLDMQNPLITQNPRALWMLLDKVHKAFGDDRFSDLIPEPPDLGLPKNPREEWTMMLQGEDVHVNPLDNDQLHIMDHNRRLQDARTDVDRDEDAFHGMVAHVMEHIQQLQQKKLMQGMVSSLVDSMQQNTATGQGLMEGNGVPMPLQQLHAHLTDMIANGGQPSQPAGPTRATWPTSTSATPEGRLACSSSDIS